MREKPRKRLNQCLECSTNNGHKHEKMPTKKHRFFATLLLGMYMSAYAESLPKDIADRVPPGYQVLSYKSGDLDNDTRTDYLVALHKADEIAIADRTGKAPRRPLMLFIQKTDGTFALAKRNDFVVFVADEGGQCDPFEDGEEGVVVKGNYFTVQNGVACGAHWTDYITFRYVPELRDWVFHKRIAENWVMNNSDAPDAEALVLEGRHVTTGKRKSPVLFEKYRPQ